MGFAVAAFGTKSFVHVDVPFRHGSVVGSPAALASVELAFMWAEFCSFRFGVTTLCIGLHPAGAVSITGHWNNLEGEIYF